MAGPRIVDAHHHLWDLDKSYYPWLSDRPEEHFFLGDYSAIKRNYLPDDYRRDAQGFDVVATVHCEAEWDREDQVGETRWLSGVAERHGMPNAIVGHVWLARDDCERVLEGHAQFPMFRGVRSKPRTALARDKIEKNAPWTMQDPAWRRGFAMLQRFGMTYDLRVPYWHLEEAAEIASLFPETPMVLNHTGFPWDRSEAGLAAWRKAMRVIAQAPQVWLKVSEFGLKEKPWDLEENRRVVLDAIEIFGIERCMFASNFPVAGLRASYRTIVEGMMDILKGFSADEQDSFFCRNAASFYRLALGQGAKP